MENKKGSLFYIEDDKVDQMAFERFAKEQALPYDYIIAGSVEEAKKILALEKFDIVVTDFLLSDGNAFDLFEDIKDTPIIVVTGSGDEETAVKAMKGGASDYLRKDLDGLSVDHQFILLHVDRPGEVPDDRVVLQQVAKRLRISDVVHCHEFDVSVVDPGTQDVAADTAESIDSYAKCH